MGTVPLDHSEVADEALRRLKLIETARGQGASLVRRRVTNLVFSLLGGIGAILVWRESGYSPPSLWGVVGVILIAGSFQTFPDRSRERLDALVELLERKGLLDPVDRARSEDLSV